MTRPSIFRLSGISLMFALGCGASASESQTGAGGNLGLGGGSGTGTGNINHSAGGTRASTSTLAGGSHTTGDAQTRGATASSGGSKDTSARTAAATGGAVATGGAKSTAAGRTQSNSSGGSEAVNSTKSAGGSNATGDSKALGGANGSTGRALTAGGANMGGTGGNSSTKSSGCGIVSPLKTGTFTESINGTTRKWMLDVPANYDGTKPYRLIFVWHPLGGSGSQIVSGGFNGLKSLANNTAIFATADGLNGKSSSGTSGTGWWNADGGDMKLVQVMLDKIHAGLCIDEQRIFSTGFSFGGMMSYTLPFEFDVFRAVAPCSGKTGIIPYNAKYTRPVPIMAFHGDRDTVAQTALGSEFFEMYRTTRNHCSAQTKAVDPSPCVEYQDCDEPSIWCLFSGAHETWAPEPQAIWKFFSQF